MIRVAYLGESGSFSESALWEYLKDLPEDQVDPISCTDFEQIAGLVRDGLADAAIMPVESTNAGVVEKAVDAIQEAGLVAEGETWLQVDLCLIVNPGARLENIQVARSHAIALRQCDQFLDEQGIEFKEAQDTASAVRELHDSGDAASAAIASERAAKLYNMDILARKIQNPGGDNKTRFVFVRLPETVLQTGSAMSD